MHRIPAWGPMTGQRRPFLPAPNPGRLGPDLSRFVSPRFSLIEGGWSGTWFDAVGSSGQCLSNTQIQS